MNGSKRRVTVVAAIVLGAVVIGLGAAVVMQHLALSRVQREIGEQQRLLADARRELKNSTLWRKDYSELSLKLGGRLHDCRWSDQMPYMVSQLTGIVEPRGVKVETLQPQPMTSTQKILRFPLRVGLQTDLATLTKVLEDIEKTVPLLEVEQLDVRNAQGKDGKLQVGMTVSSFVVLDKKAPLTGRRKLPEPLKLASAPGAASAEAEERKPEALASQPAGGGPAPATTQPAVASSTRAGPGMVSARPPGANGQENNDRKRVKRNRDRNGNGRMVIPVGPDGSVPPPGTAATGAGAPVKTTPSASEIEDIKAAPSQPPGGQPQPNGGAK